MSLPCLLTRAAKNGQRLLCHSDLPSSTQQQRQIFGEFFKKVKSEASSNEELQKAVSELKKTGDSVRERAKAASQVIGNAAAASTEAARSAAQQAQRQASEVTAAVRSRVSEAAKQESQAQQCSAAQTSGSGRVETQSASSSSSAADSGAPQQQPQPSHATKQQAHAEQPERPPGASTSHKPGSREQGNSNTRQSGGQAGAGASANTAGSSSRQRAAAAGLLARVRNAADVVRKEVIAAVLPNDGTDSATRAVGVQPRDAKDATTSSALMAAPVSRFRKQWQDMQDKLGSHPIFRRLNGLRDNRIFRKGSEMAEDMRERWETSDSAVVQRLQDMKDNMFTENEMASALREIRARDPRFDMVLFLRRLKKDVPVIIKGSLDGNTPLLKEHCAPEMVERFTGLFAAQQAQGKYSDSTVLDWSDVELVDLKFLESQPIILVQFTVQQLACIRDKHGNVVEGDANSVQRVYYYWALQQDDAGFVGVDGKSYPPRWQLREQVVRAQHNLL